MTMRHVVRDSAASFYTAEHTQRQILIQIVQRDQYIINEWLIGSGVTCHNPRGDIV
jgi:hypothetical protein